ncbi:hypothetical protein [Actinomadura sp. 3N407]
MRGGGKRRWPPFSCLAAIVGDGGMDAEGGGFSGGDVPQRPAA